MIVDFNNIRPTATIIVDASHCAETYACGFSCWVICQYKAGQRFTGSVPFKVKDSTIAEMLGIVYALNKCIEERFIPIGGLVLIQNDSIGAINCLHPNAKLDDKVARLTRSTYNDLVCFSRLEIELRHVKGHTSPDTHREARFAANRACDFYAKKAMKQMRENVKLKGLSAWQRNRLLSRFIDVFLKERHLVNFGANTVEVNTRVHDIFGHKIDHMIRFDNPALREEDDFYEDVDWFNDHR